MAQTGGMWTCPACSRRFANRHQWHSCIELTLGARLAEMSDLAVELYRAVEAAVRTCGPFRIHPQRTRIAFIAEMTFAGVAPALRWVDVSFITAAPVDDARIRTLHCYGPTSFDHRIRLDDRAAVDADVRRWLCAAWRRGTRETLDPDADVTPLVGRPLELVAVPVRARVVRTDGSATLAIPRHAGEVFARHDVVRASIGRRDASGRVTFGPDGWCVTLTGDDPGGDDLGIGDTVDVLLRAAPSTASTG